MRTFRKSAVGVCRATCLNTGVIVLQGPHQVAKKSTTISLSEFAFTTVSKWSESTMCSGGCGCSSDCEPKRCRPNRLSLWMSAAATPSRGRRSQA